MRNSANAQKTNLNMETGRRSRWLSAGAVILFAGCSTAHQPAAIPPVAQQHDNAAVNPAGPSPLPLNATDGSATKEFLLEWVRQASALYKAPVGSDNNCQTMAAVTYDANGEEWVFDAAKACGTASDNALNDAIVRAIPPMPSNLAGKLIRVGFETTGRKNDPIGNFPVEVGPPPLPLSAADSSAMKEFLTQWACQVSALYKPPVSSDNDCLPRGSVLYIDGEVREVVAIKSCGAASDKAFSDAIVKAVHPPMPSMWAGQLVTLAFYATGRKDDPSCGKLP